MHSSAPTTAAASIAAAATAAKAAAACRPLAATNLAAGPPSRTSGLTRSSNATAAFTRSLPAATIAAATVALSRADATTALAHGAAALALTTIPTAIAASALPTANAPAMPFDAALAACATLWSATRSARLHRWRHLLARRSRLPHRRPRLLLFSRPYHLPSDRRTE